MDRSHQEGVIPWPGLRIQDCGLLQSLCDDALQTAGFRPLRMRHAVE